MKRHVPHTVLECESPMLKFPPADLMQRAANVTERRAAWMICTVTARINAALELYKKRFCPEGFNSTKAIRLHGGNNCRNPTKVMHANTDHCWPFAHLESPDESPSTVANLPALRGVNESDFSVRFIVSLDGRANTSFVVRIHPSWQPRGAERFRALVRDGFFSAGGGMRFFRVLKNYIAQFGIAGDTAMGKRWRSKAILDDGLVPGYSNRRGTLSFATGGPNTRETQVR